MDTYTQPIQLICGISLLYIMYYILFTQHHNQTPTLLNDGNVNFCDTRTFQSEILAHIPQTPLLTLGDVTDENVSPHDISDALHTLLRALNKESHGCFHIIQMHSAKKRKDPFNNVLDLTVDLYTQVKNHTILLHVIIYTNQKNESYFHSLNVVNPIFTEDKFSDTPRTVSFEKVAFETGFEMYDETQFGFPLSS